MLISIPAFAVSLISFILSAMPLHKAVKTLKLKIKFRKTLLIVLISGLIISLLNSLIGLSGFITFAVLIFVYKKFFKIRYRKAFLLWILQLIFIAISTIALSLLMSLIPGIESWLIIRN